MLIGEIWLPDAARLARYLSPDELHTVFNFPYLSCAWDAAELRAVIDGTLRAARAGRRPADLGAVQSRRGPARVAATAAPATSFSLQARDHSQPVDLRLGTRRARAAALLTMALPGAVYVYQGEELGLWEVEDIPDDQPPGPDLAPHGRRRPRPGRQPGAAAVVGPGAAVRLLAAGRRRTAVAAAARAAGAS